MQKHHFITQIQQNLAVFSPFLEQKIVLNSTYFSQKSGPVNFFTTEIEKTAEILLSQHDTLYVEYYSDKLIKQFDALNKAVENIQKEKKRLQFHSSFQFPANIHRLSPNKRLQEYRKALRALNEKISWLMEQNYNEEDEVLSQALQNQITETEYRKMKCLKAIEDLEQELQFR
ncbi:primosomal replication protein N [Mannheimia granulomatis]|uniref:primosomal replication protein PriC n=1 Tax=Mannheimia granulomatis TaxID=85402 RepID=UPI00159D4F91|nr:primosomal replication protein PriC [Mannheimia granulomatis]QLB14866.1 primosomal replication protein N [Mannheimia granulomatis]